jgi:hypothetical protein
MRTDRISPDPHWRDSFAGQAALEDHVNGWRVSPAVPGGVGEVLRVARQLLIDSYLGHGAWSDLLAATDHDTSGACIANCLGEQGGHPLCLFRQILLRPVAEQPRPVQQIGLLYDE